MIDPSLELNDAIINALKGDPAVAAAVGAKVYDSVPAATAKPYINLGQPQILPDKADCVDGAEVAYTIHGWADGPKSVVIKTVGKAIAGALDGTEFTLTGHRTVLSELEQIQYLDDPDGSTKHVAVTIRVLTEPTD
jgi:hypothetical protein